jgi:hypothetical protein
MYEIDDGREDVWVGVWLNAVTEIEDMACMACIVFQHVSCSLQCNVGASEHKCGIKVALHHRLRPETRACV